MKKVNRMEYWRNLTVSRRKKRLCERCGEKLPQQEIRVVCASCRAVRSIKEKLARASHKLVF